MEKNLSDMAADDALGRKLQDFASAMTLLGYTDGASSHDGVCYLELAGFIIQKGVNVNQDLEELFRRIVFFICVSIPTTICEITVSC